MGKFPHHNYSKINTKLNLAAIHDTVVEATSVSEVTYEMAKDEARHGKALKGLLERYFK